MGLDVYLQDRAIGSLCRDGDGGYSFAYAPEVVREAGEGTTLLSGSLPVRAEPYEHEEARPYVEGLLPEGARREAIAAELGLESGDGYGLIAALGRDCPGAVVFMPEGEEPPSAGEDSPAWLSEEELEELFGEPERVFDPDSEHRMRFALPGERHKMALVLDEEEGWWAWPRPGSPSTHIVKPESGEMADFAVNEVACTEALRRMGLPVAHAELAQFGGRLCVVSKRFDRWGPGPAAERLHQESFQQALGVAHDAPVDEVRAFVRSFELLHGIGEGDAVETLYKVSFCNYLVGNGDAHAKNAALLYTDAGPLLAPFYDICSEWVYDSEDKKLPLLEAVHRGSPLIGMARIAIPCRYELVPAVLLAFRTHLSFCESLNEVADQAKEEGWHSNVIEEILQRALKKVDLLREEVNGLRERGEGGGGEL